MGKDYWGRFSDSYDKNQEYVVGIKLLHEMTKALDRLPELGKTAELGCGTGYFTEKITPKCESIIATDLSERLLNVAKMRLRENSNVMFQKEDCSETSFQNKSFDSVFMANLIHVVESPGKVLQECSRILSDRGIIVIVTFTGYGMSLWEKIKMGVRFSKAWGKPPSNTHSFSPEKLSTLLKDASFSVDSSELIGQETKAVFTIGRKNGDA